MRQSFLYSLLIATGPLPAISQSPSITLEEVIALAQSQSPGSKLAQTQNEVRHYQFQTFKSNLNPQIIFYGNAPGYNKEYYSVRQPDGSILFQSIRQTNANIGFGVDQQIPLTGGLVSLNTDLTRFDDYQAKTKRYNGTPVYLRLTQPLFAFNEYKWNKKIEPLKYEESKREYVQQIENIGQQAVKLFFDLLDAHININIATTNLKQAEANYVIEEKRINLGTTTEDKLLQLELQVLNSQQNLEKARYEYEIAKLNLNTFTGLRGLAIGEPAIPRSIERLSIDLKKAIDYARLHRPEYIAFERKKVEAQRDVAQAKAATHQIDLVASYGLNNVGTDMPKIYQNPNDQQRFNIGFNIPLVDWGRRKARYNTAIAMEKLANYNNALNESMLVQEITTLVQNFDLLHHSIELSRKTDSVALRRCTIANNLFQVGKLSVTDLNLAQSEKDNARRSYISALRQFWESYYLLRRLTLFDFRTGKELL